MEKVVEQVLTEPIAAALPREGSTIFGVKIVEEQLILRGFLHVEVSRAKIRCYQFACLLSGKN